MNRALTTLLGFALLATPAAAFARGGGGRVGVHGGGEQVPPPAVRFQPGFRGGFHGAPAFRRGTFQGPSVHVGARPVGRTWVPGYWHTRGGARLWIDSAWASPPFAGWVWMAPHWIWNGSAWVLQQATWGPPA